jgi:serine O-acetyltransferase
MLTTIRAYKKYDPAAKSLIEVLLLYPGPRALACHRVAHFLYRLGLFFFARFVAEIGRFFSGIEIHPGAKIGKAVVIDHGMGTVIGETAEIGDHVLIYQGVTLGGVDLHAHKRHPTVKNHAVLGAGSQIIGPVVIGEGAKVGANAVVLADVPPGVSVGGVPAKILSSHQNLKKELS